MKVETYTPEMGAYVIVTWAALLVSVLCAAAWTWENRDRARTWWADQRRARTDWRNCRRPSTAPAWSEPGTDVLAAIGIWADVYRRTTGEPKGGVYTLRHRDVEYKAMLVNGRVVIVDPPGTIQRPTDPSPKPRPVQRFGSAFDR